MLMQTADSPQGLVRAPEVRGVPSLGWYLVIDDDRLVGRATVRWVRQVSGYCVRFARTLHQAHCWCNSMPEPRGIVTDFELQGEMDGVEALLEFQAQGLNVPAVVLTGAPALAHARLGDTSLAGSVPVVNKAALCTELREWLVSPEHYKQLAS